MSVNCFTQEQLMITDYWLSRLIAQMIAEGDERADKLVDLPVCQDISVYCPPRTTLINLCGRTQVWPFFY